jgi:hypothetical protein
MIYLKGYKGKILLEVEFHLYPLIWTVKSKFTTGTRSEDIRFEDITSGIRQAVYGHSGPINKKLQRPVFEQVFEGLGKHLYLQIRENIHYKIFHQVSQEIQKQIQNSGSP